MIHVQIKKQKENIISFEMDGHANSGPYGYDLVCAAASAVSFGAVNALFSLCKMTPIIDKNDDGGYLYVELPADLSDETMQKANIILEAMVVSLQTIEQNYGQFIKISFE